MTSMDSRGPMAIRASDFSGIGATDESRPCLDVQLRRKEARTVALTWWRSTCWLWLTIRRDCHSGISAGSRYRRTSSIGDRWVTKS